MRRWARERQEKREDRRLIIKKLRAALLWSFRGKLGEKMACERGVPGVTGTLGKANSHFDPIQMGWGLHHRVEAAVDWWSSISLVFYTVYTAKISHFTIQKD